MEARGQIHALAALSPGEKNPVPTEQEAGWTPQTVWMPSNRTMVSVLSNL